MRILIAFEFSGMVSSAFRKRGHEAYSCDLLPYDNRSGEPTSIGLQYHLKDDVWNHLHKDWDMIIAHPPCTFLTTTAEWCYSNDLEHRNEPGGALFGRLRQNARIEALNEFKKLYSLKTPICIENPVGVVPTKLGIKPTQIIQPYMFGDDASKRTCLWIKGLPMLTIPDSSKWVKPRYYCKVHKQVHNELIVENCTNECKIVPRWSNQCNGSGAPNAPRTANRVHDRSVTYNGIANAMANEWG